MQQHEPNIAGAVVYWTAGPTQRELLEARLTESGLVDHMPGMRTNAAALKSALLDYCDEHKTRSVDMGVESHRKQEANGFEVLAKERGELSNAYDVRFSVKALENSEGELELEFRNAEFDVRPKVRELFLKHKAQLTGAAIGKMLVELLGELDGVALRPSGGVYWVPESSVPKFQRIAEFVEECGIDNKANRVYLLKTAMDESTVRAVGDAISSEVMAESAQIVEDVRENLTNEEAIARRLVRANELWERVKRYESCLGKTMDTLSNVVKLATDAAASAIAIKESNEAYDAIYQ